MLSHSSKGYGIWKERQTQQERMRLNEYQHTTIQIQSKSNANAEVQYVRTNNDQHCTKNASAGGQMELHSYTLYITHTMWWSLVTLSHYDKMIMNPTEIT